jgi:hypothetical protein
MTWWPSSLSLSKSKTMILFQITLWLFNLRKGKSSFPYLLRPKIMWSLKNRRFQCRITKCSNRRLVRLATERESSYIYSSTQWRLIRLLYKMKWVLEAKYIGQLSRNNVESLFNQNKKRSKQKFKELLASSQKTTSHQSALDDQNKKRGRLNRK